MNADGTMIDDGNVYKFDDQRYWVMINTADIEDWFRETAGDLDATITHRTEDLAMISVQGPTAQATLQPLVERDLGELGYFRFWPEADDGRRRRRARAAHRLQRREGLRARDGALGRAGGLGRAASPPGRPPSG